MGPEIIAVVGKSNSGKTTLIEKLIRELTGRGYRLGTLKHAFKGFEMDREGKDSWRHRQAGAAGTLVLSRDAIALVKNEVPSSVQDLRHYFSDMDLIIAEGFKREKLPSIEIFRSRSGHRAPLYTEGKTIVAFVTDSEFLPDLPVFGLDDTGKLADFIEFHFLGARHKKVSS